MVTFTDTAREHIFKALQKSEGEKSSLRLEAKMNGTVEFSYSMKLVTPDEKAEDDVVFDGGGFDVIVDPKSAENLEGASVDYEDKVMRSGFKFHNPNTPELPTFGDGSRPDLSGPVAERVQRLIDSEINPSVAAHGGVVHFTGMKDGKAYLSFGGGCHGCGMVDVTLKQGIEARIKEVIPEIEEVVDTTDHAEGENPYYAS